MVTRLNQKWIIATCELTNVLGVVSDAPAIRLEDLSSQNTTAVLVANGV